MQIHIVRQGETVTSIAAQYGVEPGIITRYNGLQPPYFLAVGQALAIFFPLQTAIVQSGDTLYSLAARYGASILELFRLNPQLGGSALLRPGETIVLALERQPIRETQLYGYAYPFANPQVLGGILPYSRYFVPFTYGIGADGGLLALDDEALLLLARQYDVTPLLHLSTLTEDGSFSSERAARLLGAAERWQTVADAVFTQIEQRGYGGLDVDFEFLGAENAEAYAQFLGFLRPQVNARGMELFAALAPKTSGDQKGVLYEGHDYGAIAENTDAVLLMTYEWGYTYGPPLAVSPLPSVKRVLDYAVTEIPPEKIFMGFSNYGYDWPLPYRRGETRARSISNVYAASLAASVGAEIEFDETAQAPFFRYTAEDGIAHEVWFEDARSCMARLPLVAQYGFRGVGVWNYMRPFPVLFALAYWMFDI